MTETSFAKKNSLRAAVAVLISCCLSGCASMDRTARNDGEDCRCANCQNQVQSIDMGPAIDMTGQSQPMMSPPMCELTSAEQFLPVTTFPSSDDVFSPERSQYMPPAPDSCEAQLKAAKAEFDRRLLALETQVDQEKHDRKSVDRHLVAMNREVNRLSQEIDHWRSEVRRIDRTTEEQHRSDMASLQMISEMVDQIVAEREASGQRGTSPGSSTR
ncbi:hypothetical protein [Fuerstiella marisgermanici]|uniref:Uncharacterized protein n=1 Tax=Fuerstiella marisgermanici TaxID=1891926 RepID=A0A1P8WIE1_9PLAN|nr:hypothetical protein [Fuerstiella marisgermanici]APZ93835.1 hypothetical protein Fuma_03453 [Fuerstiella marisgermanici]